MYNTISCFVETHIWQKSSIAIDNNATSLHCVSLLFFLKFCDYNSLNVSWHAHQLMMRSYWTADAVNEMKCSSPFCEELELFTLNVVHGKRKSLWLLCNSKFFKSIWPKQICEQLASAKTMASVMRSARHHCGAHLRRQLIKKCFSRSIILQTADDDHC